VTVLYRNCRFLGNVGRLERARVWKRIDITITRRRLLLLGNADVDDALHQSGPGEAPNSCRQTMSRSDLRLVRLKHVDRSIYHRVNSDDSIHLLYENY
jgi:hypothetical protein